MQASLKKSHGGTSQLWCFHGFILELWHLVIIQMDEPMSTFYQKSLYIDTKEELFIYLTMYLICNHRNMWDMDLAKLCHLTDPT